MNTDGQFGFNWDRQLKDHQSVAPTYGYVHDYQSVNSTIPDWMGKQAQTKYSRYICDHVY